MFDSEYSPDNFKTLQVRIGATTQKSRNAKIRS